MWPKILGHEQRVPYNFLFWEPKIPGLTRQLTVASDQFYPTQRLICASRLSAAVYLFAMNLLDDYHPLHHLHRKIHIIEAHEVANGNVTPIDYGVPTMKIFKRVARPIFEDMIHTKLSRNASAGILCDLKRPIFLAPKGTASVRFPDEEDQFWYKVWARASDIVHDIRHKQQFILDLPYISHKAEAQAIANSLQLTMGTGFFYPHGIRSGPVSNDILEWEREAQKTLYQNALKGKSHLTPRHRLMTEELDRIALPAEDDPILS